MGGDPGQMTVVWVVCDHVNSVNTTLVSATLGALFIR